MTATFPHRVRLRNGRNTHAARIVITPGNEPFMTTACGYPVGPRDQIKPRTTPVTCRNARCVRATTED